MLLFLALLLTVPSIDGETLLEAEEAEAWGVVVETTRAGYSGTGYITGFGDTGDSLRFHVDVEPGVYEVRIGYALSGRISPYSIWIDGDHAGGFLTGSGGRFTERKLADVRLQAGPHSMVVQGNIEIDYLKLVPVYFSPPSRPPRQLADPSAGTTTQALFDFLLDQYGVKILSGQQDLSEVDYVRQVTGREPAVGVFDLIEYSPSRMEHGANPRNAVERWMDWAGNDAIISLSWHWNAPTDLIDRPGREWWRGFYTDATTFDVEAALADTMSDRYQLLLRDIDAIAVQLRKFQDADVPILWRPLHEAWGAWFWWGAKGSGPFTELWRLLFDRLTYMHGLHNLIWVYTHENAYAGWYPGDAYVDIVSWDIYADDAASIFRSQWDGTQARFEGTKMVALSESGTLPDPAAGTDFGVWWSWFSIWNGSFIRSIDPSYLTYVYAHEHVFTRDELPAWRSVNRERRPDVVELPPAIALYPNPTSGAATLRIEVPASGNVSIEIFDVLGRVKRSYVSGWYAAGALRTPIDAGLAPGVYFVRVTGPRATRAARLVVAY